MTMFIPPLLSHSYTTTTPPYSPRTQSPEEITPTEPLVSTQQTDTYQQLAEQNTAPSADTVHIQQSTTPNTTIPAVYPLITTPQTTLPVIPFNATPMGKHLKQWGIITAGVGVGTLTMGGLLGSNQQQWHRNNTLTPAEYASPKQAYVLELLTEQPSWWEGKQSAQAHQYTAMALIPNNPWIAAETPHAHITLQPQKNLVLRDATGAQRLTIQQNAIKNGSTGMQPFLTVTTYKSSVLNADSSITGGAKEYALNIVWDANTKTMRAFNNEMLPQFSGITEKAITQCLEWFHSPESLKQGLKPKNNIHLTGAKETIPLAIAFAGITSLIGAGLWVFNKPPKPLLAKENSLDALPTA